MDLSRNMEEMHMAVSPAITQYELVPAPDIDKKIIYAEKV